MEFWPQDCHGLRHAMAPNCADGTKLCFCPSKIDPNDSLVFPECSAKHGQSWHSHDEEAVTRSGCLERWKSSTASETHAVLYWDSPGPSYCFVCGLKPYGRSQSSTRKLNLYNIRHVAIALRGKIFNGTYFLVHYSTDLPIVARSQSALIPLLILSFS